jgi:hypothetical protein
MRDGEPGANLNATQVVEGMSENLPYATTPFRMMNKIYVLSNADLS